MKFKLEFGCDNAAFDGDNLNYEIAGILRDIAGRIEQGRTTGHALDSNGNGVGTFEISSGRQPVAKKQKVKR